MRILTIQLLSNHQGILIKGVNFTYPNPRLFQSYLNFAIMNKLNNYYCHDISNIEKFNLSGIRNRRIATYLYWDMYVWLIENALI